MDFDGFKRVYLLDIPNLIFNRTLVVGFMGKIMAKRLYHYFISMTIFYPNQTKRNNMITISMILVGLILIIVGLYMGLKNIKPAYFNLLAGLVIATGTIFGLFAKTKQDIASSGKSDKILDHLMGGENFCEVTVAFSDNTPIWTINNNTSVPLKDVEVQLTDDGRISFLIERLNLPASQYFEIFNQMTYRNSFKRVDAKSGIGSFIIPTEVGQNDILLNIYIRQDNGIVNQRIQFKNFNSANRKLLINSLWFNGKKIRD